MVGPLASTIGIICFLLVARTSARLNHTRCELCTGGDSPLKCSGQTPCQLCNVSVSGGRLRSVSKAGVHIVCSTFHTFNELGTRLLDKVTSPAPPSLGRTHRMATRSGMEVARASAPWVQSLYSPLRRNYVPTSGGELGHGHCCTFRGGGGGLRQLRGHGGGHRE